MRRMYSQGELKRITLDMLKNEDLKVKTLEQSEANKTFDVVLAENTTGLTYTKRYTKALVTNGILYLVISYTLTNETEAPISTGQIRFEVQVDSKTGEGIICVDGTHLNESASVSSICPMMVNRGTTFANVSYTYLFRQGLNKIALWSQVVSSIGAGESMQYSGRIFLPLF